MLLFALLESRKSLQQELEHCLSLTCEALIALDTGFSACRRGSVVIFHVSPCQDKGAFKLGDTSPSLGSSSLLQRKTSH